MKNKYYILAFTFLCLLIGQNSFAQTTGGDFDDEKQSMHDFLTELFDREVSVFRTDPDTGYVLTVQGPGEGGGEHFGFVGFESSNDGTITVSWGDFVDPATTSNPPSQGTDLSPSNSSWSGFIDWSSFYSITIPNPNSDCYFCNMDDDDSNDVASIDNNSYVNSMPAWVQTNYLDFVTNSNPSTSSIPTYSGALGEVILFFGDLVVNYGKVPVEEANDLKLIMGSNILYDIQIFELVRDNPGSGLKLLKAYLEAYPDGDIGQFLKDYYEPKNLCIEYPLICGQDNTRSIDSNTINKPILTQTELTGLIQNMVGDYTVTVKHDYIGTVTDYEGTHTYKGRITRIYNNTTMHSYYYFMPYKNGDSYYVENNHYKIQEPVSNIVYPLGSESLDADGMPKNYQIVMRKLGSSGIFFKENNSKAYEYCENCTKIENNNDPKYPQLAKVLPKIKSLVLGNPVMLQYMMTLSGYTRAQIINLLSVTNLKKMLRVADIKGVWGLYESRATPDIIFVRANLIASLETGGFKLGGENENLNGTSFFAAMVIVHELIHYGRHMNKLPQLVDGIYEAGETFETWVFGEILGVNGVTNLATQYGWTF